MLVLKANDHVTDGSLELHHSDNSGAVSPFGFTFTRHHEGGKYTESTCGFNISKQEAMKLAKFIIENL